MKTIKGETMMVDYLEEAFEYYLASGNWDRSDAYTLAYRHTKGGTKRLNVLKDKDKDGLKDPGNYFDYTGDGNHTYSDFIPWYK